MTQKPSLHSNLIRLALWAAYATLCFKASTDWLSRYEPLPTAIWPLFLAAASLGVPVTLAGICSGSKALNAAGRGSGGPTPEKPLRAMAGSESGSDAAPHLNAPLIPATVQYI